MKFRNAPLRWTCCAILVVHYTIPLKAVFISYGIYNNKCSVSVTAVVSDDCFTIVSAGHVTFSESDTSNQSHDRRFISLDAQKSAHYLHSAQVACKQPVPLPTGGVVADSNSRLPPDAHSAYAEVRVAPSKRPRDESREVASAHFARLASDCLKVIDSTKTVRPHVGRFTRLFCVL